MLSRSVLPAGPISRGLGITVVKVTGASLPVRENLTNRLRIHPFPVSTASTARHPDAGIAFATAADGEALARECFGGETSTGTCVPRAG
jgi:hypothetical protein